MKWKVNLESNCISNDTYISLQYEDNLYLYFRVYNLNHFIQLLETKENNFIGQLFGCDLELVDDKLMCLSDYSALYFPIHNREDLITALKKVVSHENNC